MTFSNQIFDNGPEQYEGPLLDGMIAQGFALSAAIAMGLVVYLVAMILAHIFSGSRHPQDPTTGLIVWVLGALALGCLSVSTYGLWLFHLGSLQAGVPTLQDNHPEAWLVVRLGLAMGAVALLLAFALKLLLAGVGVRAVLGHGAPLIALVAAALISGVLSHEHRDAASLIVGGLLIYGVINALVVSRSLGAAEHQLAA